MLNLQAWKYFYLVKYSIQDCLQPTQNVTKQVWCFYGCHMEDQMYRDTQKRELNQVRSKPDPVKRPARTDRAIVHHQNGTQ